MDMQIVILLLLLLLKEKLQTERVMPPGKDNCAIHLLQMTEDNLLNHYDSLLLSSYSGQQKE
jgi:hypothetical protein